jgi:hypothetical protein
MGKIGMVREPLSKLSVCLFLSLQLRDNHFCKSLSLHFKGGPRSTPDSPALGLLAQAGIYHLPQILGEKEGKRIANLERFGSKSGHLTMEVAASKLIFRY